MTEERDAFLIALSGRALTMRRIIAGLPRVSTVSVHRSRRGRSQFRKRASKTAVLRCDAGSARRRIRASAAKSTSTAQSWIGRLPREIWDSEIGRAFLLSGALSQRMLAFDPKIWFDRPLSLTVIGLPARSARLTASRTQPAHAIFLDVGSLDAIEMHAHAKTEHAGVVIGTFGLTHSRSGGFDSGWRPAFAHFPPDQFTCTCAPAAFDAR
jgi:hypothetical protein